VETYFRKRVSAYTIFFLPIYELVEVGIKEKIRFLGLEVIK
jgi:hypothetical protein